MSSVSTGFPPTATTTALGIVKTASSSEIRAGSVTNGSAFGPAGFLAAMGMSAVFTSAAQTITTFGTYNIAHGLGRVPVLLQFFIVCTVAEYGYSVGDRVLIDHQADFFPSPITTSGLTPWVDTTNVNFKIIGNIYVANRSATAVPTITPANWNLFVQAWA